MTTNRIGQLRHGAKAREIARTREQERRKLAKRRADIESLRKCHAAIAAMWADTQFAPAREAGGWDAGRPLGHRPSMLERILGVLS